MARISNQPILKEINSLELEYSNIVGRTDAEAPILWPPDAKKTWLIEKDPDAGKDWRQKEK